MRSQSPPSSASRNPLRRFLLIGFPISTWFFYVLLPVSIGLIVLQSVLLSRDQAIQALQRNQYKIANDQNGMGAILPDSASIRMLPEQIAEIQREATGPAVGYVDVHIPDQIVAILEDDEDGVEGKKELLDDDDVAFVQPGGVSGPVYDEPHVEYGGKGAASDFKRNVMIRKSPPMGGPVVSGPFPKKAKPFDDDTEFELTWTYLQEEKLPEYVGNDFWVNQFAPGTRHYWNSVATFGFSKNEAPDLHYHGLVGVYPNGTQAWRGNGKTVPPIDQVNRTLAMQDGGFYKELADSMPLDRIPNDTREELCKNVVYNYKELEDASVVITFYNEPLSTLLRSVHSVLNNTPPPLLREIILVDDHSDLQETLPGSDLYEYVKLLPKVKILRLGERRGLVWARLAGAQAAKAPILVIFDSHVEVNFGWLEPQMQRLAESPQSIVFPQILALDADTFKYNEFAGIGCWLTWKWNMIEQATFNPHMNRTDAVASPSMAGGLFAVRQDWFWELGGYDEAFAMWGSENVEMGFRTWMCGGRLECTPCSRTYHIYRSGGSGYTSPSEAVWRNKLRTARLWMDEWFQISKKFLGDFGDLGNPDAILDLKKRLNCKPFSWFLENVDPLHEGRHLDDIEFMGEIKSEENLVKCIDSLGHKEGESYGLYNCHGRGGTQGWFKDRSKGRIKSFGDEKLCLGEKDDKPVFVSCREFKACDVWKFNNETKQLIINDHLDEKPTKCLRAEDGGASVAFADCNESDIAQKWRIEAFVPDPDFQLPDYSEEYKRLHAAVPATA